MINSASYPPLNDREPGIVGDTLPAGTV